MTEVRRQAQRHRRPLVRRQMGQGGSRVQAGVR